MVYATHSIFRLAALLCALCYIVGIIYIAVIAPNFADSIMSQFQHLVNYPSSMMVWYAILYVVFGLSLLMLNHSARYVLPREKANALWSFSFMLGDIWSGFVLATGFIMISTIGFFQHHGELQGSFQVIWQTVYILVQSIGGGIELLGGMWMMAISMICRQNQLINKLTLYIGIMIGLAGVLTIFPALEQLTLVFGLGQILWFFCLAGGEMATKK
ncbi:hypothetical protein Q4575_16130 [Psychrosphaera sp. 1_MG-2023]|uniref:hypothetical protein n=1 Tax=Psychrosphaera sp. 1_MG-2023 TaxID=3062643 RepID=UPI0026E2EEDA|nr:hypothetical protein [Psychrosphaera sp. 1_MG-2023]MDO6720943.1 hypothetical protein [Psychrosphaera sp. 1_MG-2023]